MLPKIDPTSTSAWKSLQAHFETMKQVHMRTLFAADEKRFTNFSVRKESLVFDYSKNIVTGDTMKNLFALARECQLPAAIEAMFRGEKINETENRAVLHTALRNFSGKPILNDGQDVMPDVKSVLASMKSF